MSETRLSLALTNQRAEVARLTEAVDRFGHQCHLSDEDLHNVHLILDELVINVIKYAFVDTGRHTINVDLRLDGSRLTISVEDDGQAFDPTAAPPPRFDLPVEQRRIGGLGIHIVRTLSDTVTYQRRNGCNVLTVVKRVNG